MRFWRNPTLYVFLSLLVYAIPSLLNLTQFFPLPLWLQILLFGVAIAAAISLNFWSSKRVYVNPEKILELMVKSVFPPEILPNIRANIMIFERGLFRKGKLRIKYAYNMLGMPDRYLELLPNQGCAGVAFTKGTIHSVDLTKYSHGDYRVPSDKVWKEMKSIISFPIRRVTNKREVIGVLNIDSSLPMDKVGFLSKNVRLILGGYAEILGELL